MQAVEITRPGGPEVLRLTERPTPRPGPGEVLIQVAAPGVNRPDVFQRMGRYPPPPGASDLPGLEVAGTAVEGDFSAGNSFKLKPGDVVCALLAGGGYAEYAVAPLGQCLPVPKGLSPIEAAALPETFFTVWSNVFDRGQLGRGEGGPDESLLVQGGSSGIGAAAIQIAHALGHAVFAHLGGSAATLDMGKVVRRRLVVTGSTLRPRPVAFKAAIARRLREVVWPLIEAGKVRPVVHQVFPAAEAAKAHALMETGAHIGKLVLRW